jgi:hypothetical protein
MVFYTVLKRVIFVVQLYTFWFYHQKSIKQKSQLEVKIFKRVL